MHGTKIKTTKTMKTKAIFYTMDALLASLLLIAAVGLIYANYTPEDVDISQNSYISQDVLAVLSELRVNEINSTFIISEINNGNITNPNITALDQIGTYWALNQTDKAQELLSIVLNDTLKGSSIAATMGSSTLMYMNNSKRNNVVVYNRMISGIEQGRPLTGSSGSSYLKKIRNKRTSSYSYFGGFVGEGNITVMMQLPSDFSSSRMLASDVKLETPGTFKIFINNAQCGSSYAGDVGKVSLWSISPCNSSFVAGTNTILIAYTSSLNTSYISGGFIKATYTTDTLIENTTRGHYRYYFPDINGFINFYDTLSVQGNIDNWTLNITFYNPYQTIFTFGNESLFVTQGNSTANQSKIVSRTNQNLLQEPIPIRIAVTNFSNITTAVSGLPADIFVVTDVSGSMADCIGNALRCSYQYRKNATGTYIPISCAVYHDYECDSNPDNPCGGSPFNRGRNYPSTPLSCNQSKLDAAKSADTLFVYNVTAASSLHKIGLVDYSTSAHAITLLTGDAATLYSEINTYAASGSTCSCCALNMARDNVINSTNKRFIILLSDGEPNICCTGFHDYTGTGSGSGCSGGGISPKNWTIVAGQEACRNNITVYTIGFGADMSSSGQDTMQKTACNYSLYYNATNASQLPSVFQNITKDILIAANFSSQTVTVVGNFTPSRLYGSSYIDVEYTPLVESSEQGKISLVAETAQFNSCNASVLLPPNIEIRDAFVTSYSSNHWTKYVGVNGVAVFNLSEYGTDYVLLGDPFVIQIPSVILNAGAYNDIRMTVGDNPYNNSNCSNNNTLIYTALINVSTGRTAALNRAVGCNWIIQSTIGSTFNVTIPKEYYGSNTCRYTSSNIMYDHDDVYDVAVYNMLKQLDYQNNGTIFFDLTQNDLEIILITTGQIAYMWGPSIMRVEAW